MKILAVMGSPRKSGNTARLLNLVRESVPKEDEVEIVSLVDYDIRRCIGCSRCQTDTEHFACVQHDDANMLLKKSGMRMWCSTARRFMGIIVRDC